MSSSSAASSTPPSSSFLEGMFSLTGRTALVTGGGTGIGSVLATGLARAGANVVVAGRRREPLEETCGNIRQLLRQDLQTNSQWTADELDAHLSRRVAFVPCDISKFDDLETLVDQAAQLTGTGPTIVIHNAGINVRQPEDALNPEHWKTSMDLMLTAPFFLTRAMMPHMLEQKYGRVISIASLQSYQAFPNSIPYATAKAGILGWTRAVAEAYGHNNNGANITVNAIAPGYVETSLTAAVFADKERAQALADSTIVKRNSVAEDLVGAAIFLSSPAAAYITGQCLPVEGGFTALGRS